MSRTRPHAAQHPPAPERAEAARVRHGSRRPRFPRRPRRPRGWKALLAALVACCLLAAGGLAAGYASIDIPAANRQATAQSNVFLYRDGTRLARTGEVNRESVSLRRVPLAVRRAFVAAEDEHFYQDHGVDPVGTARGLLNTLTGKGRQGGSTITQQYVKNYYLSQEQTLTRKAKELAISLKVDRRRSKDAILAGYLNTSYFGRNAYGVQAAARAYYRKDVADLTTAEGAYLAALLQAPSQYDWAAATPEGRRLVRARWDYVLGNMAEMGWLSRTARARLRFPRPAAPRPVLGLDGRAGYLVDAARAELVAAGVSEQELAAGGWTITLSVDRERQRALEHAVAHPGRGRRPAAGTQTGAVSLDPRTGRVRALYGGRDYTRHYLDNATRADYQAGAAFLPLVTAAALEAAHARDPKAHLLTPHRIKSTAVALGMDAHAAGFTPSAKTLKLGLMATSPLELAGVYASLGHQGRRVTPSIVLSARRGGDTVRLPAPVGDRAVSARSAAATVSVLRRGGPGAGRAGAQGVVRAEQAVARVDGPSDDRKAAWYVGLTPSDATVVAEFGEDSRGRQTVLDGRQRELAAGTWQAYTGERRPAAPEGRRSGALPGA